MNHAGHTHSPHSESQGAGQPNVGAEQRLSEIANLLQSLDAAAANSGQSARVASEHENQLIQVRLGVASSLFMALRCKHPPTASHSMRVALGCTAWAVAREMPNDERDRLEVAALLHDVGKIGVPDHLLQKPHLLTAEESALMGRYSELGLEILRSSAPQELIDIVRYVPAWFDGSAGGSDRNGKELPLGSRMLAIVDAFDAMTTEQVYRRAMSRERAVAELFQHAGTQFDPELVEEFSRLEQKNQIDLQAEASQRWLAAIRPKAAEQGWQLQVVQDQPAEATSRELFQEQLLDNLRDGVVFVDSQLQITLWNRGAERLSGIAGAAAHERIWLPSLVQLRDERGSIVPDENCPVAAVLASGMQSSARMSIAGRGGKDMPIEFFAIPVTGKDGTKHGATILLRDASSESTLEERCQNLQDMATRDSLTRIANRAEFDRAHVSFLDAHVESGLPCSLIICDIDHFKQINDNYGHQAGDEAIKSMAALLQRHCAHGDLVARYGGEEFVMLCADCNNGSASARAEKIRKALAETAHPMLGSKHITASFGVTENQPGDTPETMLRRADRALLDAKAGGRNRTVQLGSGTEAVAERRRRGWWLFGSRRNDPLLEHHLVTNVPLNMAIEKLRGFVADHGAIISSTGDDSVELTLEGDQHSAGRRSGDRLVPFSIEIRFSEKRGVSSNTARLDAPQSVLTKMIVTIRPRRDRDRRRSEAVDRARHLLSSLKSYLMARDDDSPGETA